MVPASRNASPPGPPQPGAAAVQDQHDGQSVSFVQGVSVVWTQVQPFPPHVDPGPPHVNPSPQSELTLQPPCQTGAHEFVVEQLLPPLPTQSVLVPSRHRIPAAQSESL